MTSLALVDIGCNLVHKSFAGDRDDVLQRAFDAHVSVIVVTGTTPRNSQLAADLAASYRGKLYSTAGVHPHDAKQFNQSTVPLLRRLAARPEVVAIGECGLDFNRMFSTREQQEACFRAQVQLAVELKLPLFLHEREAHAAFVAILREFPALPKVVVHCFTGTESELRSYLEMGFYIGITGWVCDPVRGKHLVPLLKLIPKDRLMLETDSPFLTPKNADLPSRNEPCFLPHVLRAVAQALGEDVSDVAARTTRNAREFFGSGIMQRWWNGLS